MWDSNRPTSQGCLGFLFFFFFGPSPQQLPTGTRAKNNHSLTAPSHWWTCQDMGPILIVFIEEFNLYTGIMIPHFYILFWSYWRWTTGQTPWRKLTVTANMQKDLVKASLTTVSRASWAPGGLPYKCGWQRAAALVRKRTREHLFLSGN